MSMQAAWDVLENRLREANLLHELGAITDEEREQLYRDAYNEARRHFGLPPMPSDWRPPMPPGKVVLSKPERRDGFRVQLIRGIARIWSALIGNERLVKQAKEANSGDAY